MIIQMHYNAFHEKSLKATVVLENLTRFDRIIFDKLLAPLLETICKMSRLHIKSDFERVLSLFDAAESSRSQSWYSKIETNIGIIQSSQF